MPLRPILARILAAALCLGGGAAAPAWAQTVDCNRLAAQIAASGRDGPAERNAAAAQRQRDELGRATAYAQRLGCDRISIPFLGPPRPAQCDGLNAQIARMQANLASLEQAAYGGDRAALQRRFDAYCRGAGAGGPGSFFDRLFDPDRPVDDPDAPILRPAEGEEAAGALRGRPICVRTCDGGFFPLDVGGRDPTDLQNLCTALCPGAEAKLFSRAPGAELKAATALDGSSYADLPNALKFEKAFDRTCSCKPPDKSWAEALAGAETLLGEGRAGDIVVTPEKAEELSRPRTAATKPANPRKFDAGSIARSLGVAPADVKPALERQRRTADEAAAADAAAAAQAPTASGESSGIARTEGDRRTLGEGPRAPDGAAPRSRGAPPRM